MNSQEIEQKLEDDRSAFYREAFPHPLPKNFLAIFKRVIMKTSPARYKLTASDIGKILSKKLATLDNLDVRRMINVIVEAPLELMYDSPETYVAQFPEIETLIKIANIELNKLDVEIGTRRKTLQDLSGVNNGTRSGLYKS